MATIFWPKMWHHRKWRIYVWKHVACICKCYHQMRVVKIWEWTTLCAQTSLCWWPYTGLLVHKVEQHSYVQTAVLCGKSALKCHAELHQASVWTGDMQYSTCSLSVHTDVSVTITEQCMDEVRCCAVTELAEPFVCVQALVNVVKLTTNNTW